MVVNSDAKTGAARRVVGRRRAVLA